MKHSELRHQPRHVNPRIQDTYQFIALIYYLHYKVLFVKIQYFVNSIESFLYTLNKPRN